MLQLSSTGLKTRNLVAKTVGSCLPEGLPYNWDEKLRELVVGISLSRSLVLQNIAQTRAGHVRTIENDLSAFLGRERLNMSPAQRACVINVLKRMGRRRLWKHNGKVALIIDATSHAKARSRRKKRGLPGKGSVRMHNVPADKTILVPGYQEIWIGILLSDRTVLPLTRRLWSEKGPDSASMNLAELAEIRRAVGIVREAFKLEVVLVADSGYRRKDLLHWLKETEKLDFVIRLEGKLTVQVGALKGLLEDFAAWWPQRLQIQWREKSKRILLSDVSAQQATAKLESKETVEFNAVCLTPSKGNVEPMFLATTLPIDTKQDLTLIVRLYSWRWGIETFFSKFKNGLNAKSWRVFSSWEAIDRLLAAAHMAYMILVLLAEFVRRGRTAQTRLMARRMKEILRSRFARFPELTLGRFFLLIASDFQSPGRAVARL